MGRKTTNEEAQVDADSLILNMEEWVWMVNMDMDNMANNRNYSHSSGYGSYVIVI